MNIKNLCSCVKDVRFDVINTSFDPSLWGSYLLFAFPLLHSDWLEWKVVQKGQANLIQDFLSDRKAIPIKNLYQVSVTV